jgi:hypothetical protein
MSRNGRRLARREMGFCRSVGTFYFRGTIYRTESARPALHDDGQFDLHGVGDFALMYCLGKGRGVVTNIPYPQAGPYPVETQVPYALARTTKSAVRAGIVNAKARECQEEVLRRWALNN